jgi:hypothetical protein
MWLWLRYLRLRQQLRLQHELLQFVLQAALPPPQSLLQ